MNQLGIDRANRNTRIIQALRAGDCKYDIARRENLKVSALTHQAHYYGYQHLLCNHSRWHSCDRNPTRTRIMCEGAD